MKKQIYKMESGGHKFIVESLETETAVHNYVTYEGGWTPESEVEFTEWFGTIGFPYATKDIITTFLHGGETLTHHHPDGPITRERPGLPTEVIKFQ